MDENNTKKEILTNVLQTVIAKLDDMLDNELENCNNACSCCEGDHYTSEALIAFKNKAKNVTKVLDSVIEQFKAEG